MVYSNKFVVCVLVNGVVQNELANGEVHIPCGSEYVLRFRNKHNRRAVVKFTIDNENVSGNGYIIPANDYVDIMRHADKDAAFKLVDLNSPEAVDAGKNGPNFDKSKGLIEANFYLEKERVLVKKPLVHVPYNYYGHGTLRGMNKDLTYDSSLESTYAPPKAAYNSLCQTNNVYQTTDICDTSAVDACTVEGSMTGQSFTTSYIDVESHSTTIKLVLKGTKNLHLEAVRLENKRIAEEIALIEENKRIAESNRKMKDEIYRLTLEENAKLKAKLDELRGN